MPFRRFRVGVDTEDAPESSSAALKRRRMLIDDNEEEHTQHKKRVLQTKPTGSQKNIIINSDDEVDDNEENEEDEEEGESEDVNGSLIYQPLESLTIDKDGYVEGSIVKITLKNFVTYDYCEFQPGPQLNMIIGPNGTGKSTIVCAVALGLGGSTSLLGRAKNISEFVKTGEDEASIQIELKRVGRKNTVIFRHINKANNTSNWKLDGKSTSQREIMNVISKLNIQVDNLCQFLPQDKVAEFAQLTPCQLLVRTQVAVGDKSLSNQHEKLIEKRNQLKILDRTHLSNLDRHRDLEKRNELLQKDVQKIQEREEIAKVIALLKAKLPLAKYTDAKKKYDDAKLEEQDLKNQKIELERAMTPLLSKVNELQKEDTSILNLRKGLEEDVNTLATELTRIANNIKESKSKVKSHDNQIAQLKTREKMREKEIKKMEDHISALEEATSVEPPADSFELVEDIKSFTQDISRLKVDNDNSASVYRDLNQQKNSVENSLRQSKRALNELKDIGRIKMENLKQSHMDTYKAYMWYKDNKTLFKGRIFGPIQLCINVKDKRFVHQVETALGGRDGNHLRTFVCEYAEDYKKFMSEMVDKQKYRLTASWPGDIDIAKLTKSPCSDEELKSRFGLDHFIVNLLEGPPLVLAYLSQQIYIDNYPIGLNEVNIQQFVDKTSFQRFIIGKNMYRVKKYSYGQGGSQTAVRTIASAKLLTDSIDNEKHKKVLDEIKGHEQSLAEVDAEIKQLTDKRNEFNQKISELQHQKEDRQSQRRDIINKHNKWQGQKRRLANFEQELALKKDEPSDIEDQILKEKQKIKDEVNRRGTLVLQYHKRLKGYVNKVLERNTTSLKALAVHGKHQAISNILQSGKRDLDLVEHSYRKAHQITAEFKQVAKKYQEQAKKAGGDLLEELRDEFKQIYDDWQMNGLDQTQIEIEDAINQQEAKSNALKMANPLAITTYETLTKELKELNAKIETEKEQLENLKNAIQTIRGRWEPRLENLISRISAKFSEELQRIGCAGEVCISKDEDFDKWGIEIRVKFRDNEKLQLLTGQRQSGGERAVSTILYLMALQDLAITPFRVVDEINQGMDPRNERMIHEQIVYSATKAGTAQYFLITPKLLSDLYYNEKMTVLCIYNGEWQPERMKSAREYLKSACTTKVA